jgi:hypothetical protein
MHFSAISMRLASCSSSRCCSPLEATHGPFLHWRRYWLAALIAVLLTFSSGFADSLPSNQLPMCGEREKNECMRNADADFIASVTKNGVSRERAAEQVLQLGRSYWYGRFFWTQGQLDKSLEQLNRALQLDSTARDARSNIAFVYYLKKDFGKACTWAKDAQMNGDALEKGFLEDMCSGEGKP